MADFGLRVRNNSLITQIDSTFRNLSFWTKGTAVANQPTGFGSWRYATFNVPYSTSSAFAWRADFPSFVMSAGISGGTMTVTILSYIVGGSQATINWYVFATPDTTGFPGGQVYGLRVKDAAGGKSFDSRNQYMKYVGAVGGVAADIPTTQDNLPPEYLNYQMPLGSLPAVLQGNLATTITEVPVGVGPGVQYMFFWQSSCVRQSGSTINVAKCVRVQGPYNDPTNPPQITRDPWNYTVIDVNGL